MSTVTTDTTSVRGTADRLVERMRHVATENAYVTKARDGKLTAADVANLVRLENATLDNVTQSIALGAARMRNTAAMDFLIEVGRLVAVDRKNVRAAAVAYGTPLEGHPGEHLDSTAYGYAGFVNWACLHTEAAAMALIAYVDITLWHEACVLLTPALRELPGLPHEVVHYFALYEERPSEILDLALELVAAETGSERDLLRAADTTALMEEHLAAFWRAADR
ncbi:hypothetical protein ACN20G_28970 (plasmid) [Streptomyces sp. BI20]|uniref:hypothetical protein n=1 Tax=Streptomyces sp. BI20 TaxID=3403460 RepID=UPI003C753FB1